MSDKEISRKISFGKVGYLKESMRVNEADIVISLDHKKGVDCLSICGNIWNNKHTDIYMGGQCLDDMIPYIERDTLYSDEFREIKRLHDCYHLNDMHAGTEKQEAALEEVLSTNHMNYEERCNFLKSVGLYEDTLPDGTLYRYGSDWLAVKIPENDLNEIKDIIENGLEAISKYIDKDIEKE